MKNLNSEQIEEYQDIFKDLLQELDHSQKWGEQFDKNNTLNDWISYICGYATDAGKMLKSDPSSTGRPLSESRAQFLKAAGLCINAVKYIDNGELPKRHYDK